ncbi:MAG: hypothetical protein ACI9DG_001126 [Oleispira sp.]|jgi:hypothetical protein
MYMDEVVLSGLLIVFLTCAFFVGFYVVIKRDIAKKGTGAPDSKPSK